jgi:hypothetical protein
VSAEGDWGVSTATHATVMSRRSRRLKPGRCNTWPKT